MEHLTSNHSVSKVTMLVGPPCVGKSHYVKSLQYNCLISSDRIVEQLCVKYGMQYHEFFAEPSSSSIKKEHRQCFDTAISQSKYFSHVVWDLTNLTCLNRKNVMSHYPKAIFDAVVFEFKGYEETLLQINKQRYKQVGKFIAESVMENMFTAFEEVTVEEGFANIIKVDINDFILAQSHKRR